MKTVILSGYGRQKIHLIRVLKDNLDGLNIST